MQNGSLICRQRQRGPSAWEFRWREPGSDGKRRHRRIVLGSTLEFVDECAARQAIVALQLDINGNDVRNRGTNITLAAAYSHFRQQELRTESAWRTFSIRNGYEGYLKKWVIPRWGTPWPSIKAREVELWMRSLPLARSTCAKIRNVMSVLFNHTIRHGIGSVNPIRLVRQSAKRKKIPLVLTPDEIRKLIAALPLKLRNCPQSRRARNAAKYMERLLTASSSSDSTTQLAGRTHIALGLRSETRILWSAILAERSLARSSKRSRRTCFSPFPHFGP
jgi:hypothetical protein